MAAEQLLCGLSIVENASVITGPFAGGLLAHLGANVIKVESPRGGDQFRDWGKSALSVRPNFAAYNRGKRSLTLDLKQSAGRAIYKKLVSTADAVIENSRPGVMDKLGVGWSDLHNDNPALIYCYISGLGSWGPECDRPTYDAIAQALSGLWSQFTDLSNPEPLGPNLADQITGLFAAIALLSGLEHRRQTGVGVKLEVSMLASCMSFLGSSLSALLMEGAIPNKRTRSRSSQVYAFLDNEGKPFVVQLSGLEKFWESLCRAIGMQHLMNDPRFKSKSFRVDNYDALHSILQEVFQTETREHWEECLTEHDVPVAPILSVPEAVHHPQVEALGLIETSGPIQQHWFRAPISKDRKYLGATTEAPFLSQDTRQILSEIGYSEEDILQLRDANVIL